MIPSGRNRFRQFASACFAGACGFCTLICLVILGLLLFGLFWQGWEKLTWHFITSPPSYKPEKAGIYPAMMGTLYLAIITLVASVPVGVGSAIYLEEYAKPTPFRRLVQLNISNLAGVPSIVFGILGMGVFRILKLNQTLIAGGLTLALVVLPIIILSAQEALRAVPNSIRHAAYGLGATRWQTVWRQVLPAALPGILTGVILGISRSIGEAAPLLAVGVFTTVFTAPKSLTGQYSSLPNTIFAWAEEAGVEFHELAASAILVLLAVLVMLNSLAVFLRRYYGRNLRQ